MKQVIRTALGLTLGVATFLIGQLVIENIAWWLTSGTSTFADPFVNALKLAAAGAAGIGVAAMIGMRPVRRRSLL